MLPNNKIEMKVDLLGDNFSNNMKLNVTNIT